MFTKNLDKNDLKNTCYEFTIIRQDFDPFIRLAEFNDSKLTVSFSIITLSTNEKIKNEYVANEVKIAKKLEKAGLAPKFLHSLFQAYESYGSYLLKYILVEEP